MTSPVNLLLGSQYDQPVGEGLKQSLEAASFTAVRFGSIDEWCQLSGLGKTISYQLLRDGHLKAKKLGRRTLIDLAAGLQWLETQPDWTSAGPAAKRP